MRTLSVFFIVGALLSSPAIYSQDKDDFVRMERKLETLKDKTETLSNDHKDHNLELNQVKDLSNDNYLKLSDTRESLDNLSQEMTDEMNSLRKQVGLAEKGSDDTKSELDRFWILVAAFLIFFMQAGFKSLEMGLVRSVHGDGIGLKNLIDLLVISAVFFFVGFGFMFGTSHNGFFGTGLFMPTAFDLERLVQTGETDFGMEFFLFQLTFAATAATIVSGAMSERIALMPYLVMIIFVGIFIYPLIGHMIWGNQYLENNRAFLADLGFYDFAGSTAVHSVGAWVGLIGIWVIGPRIGRFKPDGSVNTNKFKPHSLGYSVLGVLILWLGWWGFNGGSVGRFDVNVASVIVNTNLAGAFAGISAMLHAYIFDRNNSYFKIIGGVLGGLVAITASANIVDSIAACGIGVIAGVVHNWAYDLMLKLKLDDPVGAIPVHGFCGVWGTLAVGIFASDKAMKQVLGLAPDAAWSRMDQIVTQLMGIGVVLVVTSVAAFIFFKIIEVSLGLRVDPEKENTGYMLIADK